MIRQNAHSVGKRATNGRLEVDIVTISSILLAFGIRHRERLLWNTIAVRTIGKFTTHYINANILRV